MQAEASRLAPKESDWNLPGATSTLARTRGKKIVLSRLLTSPNNCKLEVLSDSDDSEESEEEDPQFEAPAVGNDAPAAGSNIENEEPVAAADPGRRTKPPNSRVILEVKALIDLVEPNLQACPKCGSKMKLEMKNVCIATSARIVCTNEKHCCHIVYGQSPAPAQVPVPAGRSALKTRNTDFAANVLFVLSFLASGDGGTEAALLLGHLGLPNSTTMGTRSFGIIETQLYPSLRRIMDEIVQENIEEEVAAQFKADGRPDEDLIKWKNKEEPAIYAKVTAGTDMGWQGRKQSLSGHAFFCGYHTRKVIHWKLLSRHCSICDHANKAGCPARTHVCTKNWTGSSKSMESNAVLQMYLDLYNTHQVYVGVVIADDDSSIKAKLRWNNKDYKANYGLTRAPQIVSKTGVSRPRPNLGKIPGTIPTPLFGADPNHRTKLVGKQLYGICRRTVKDERLTMTEMDAYRLKRNYGYLVRQIPSLEEDQYEDAAKSFIRHHFDEHKYCGGWCRRKLLTAQEKKDSNKFYRCMTKDEVLYKTLRAATDKYTTLEAMKDIAHAGDTQINKSLNWCSISWKAPKNKVYSGSVSLELRIIMAVIINSIGTLEVYKRVFSYLGIAMDAVVLHFLQPSATNDQPRLRQQRHPNTRRDAIISSLRSSKMTRSWLSESGTHEKGRTRLAWG